nr:Mitochondrial oxaloacetate carrier protein [Polyrhizophydium stewartii]
MTFDFEKARRIYDPAGTAAAARKQRERVVRLMKSVPSAFQPNLGMFVLPPAHPGDFAAYHNLSDVIKRKTLNPMADYHRYDRFLRFVRDVPDKAVWPPGGERSVEGNTKPDGADSRERSEADFEALVMRFTGKRILPLEIEGIDVDEYNVPVDGGPRLMDRMPSDPPELDLATKHRRPALALGDSEGTLSAKAYPNALSAFWRILRNEGIAGIQKGLAPAYVYQLLLNGTRLGMYEPLKHTLQASMDSVAAWVRGVDRIDGHAAPFVAMIASGATTGIIGSFIASPLFLVKTRMQSYVQGSGAVVGHQHSYVTKGTLYSLRAIYNSGGLRGLWRGADASMMRTGIGSAVQLSSYDTCKQMLLRSGWFDPARGGANGAIELHFMASLATSFLVCAAMNPFDVASTRMYNQHSAPDGRGGVLYKNGLDCLVKTVRAEGPSALYKGFFAHYLRLGPHTVLTFVFFEQLRRLSQRLDEYLAKK